MQYVLGILTGVSSMVVLMLIGDVITAIYWIKNKKEEIKEMEKLLKEMRKK